MTSHQGTRSAGNLPAFFGARPYNAVGADARIGPGSVRAEQRCSAGNLPAFFGTRPYNAVGDGSPVPRSVHVRECGTGRLIAGAAGRGMRIATPVCGLARNDRTGENAIAAVRSERCLLPVARYEQRIV